MTIPSRFTELELPCTLTDEEVQSRGRMLGETIWAIDDTEAARTETMKGFKQRLTGLNETQRKLAKVIRDRVETRMVRCVIYFHVPAEGTKRIIRTDTGEVVSEESMTDSEKQLNLFAAQTEFEKFMQDQGVAEPPLYPADKDPSPGTPPAEDKSKDDGEESPAPEE